MKKNLLLDFFSEHQFTYILGFFFMFLSSYIQTLLPKVLGTTIDMMKINGFDKNAVLISIFYMFLIAVGAFICTFLWRNLVIGNARKLECHLREKLFRHFQTLSPEFYSKRKTGDLITYAINDLSAVRMAFGPATAISFNGIVICVSSVYFMLFSIDYRLTLITLAPLPIVVWLMLKIGKQIQLHFRKVQENFGTISDKVQESIYGIRVLKSYVQEEQEISRFETLNNQMMESNIQMVRISSYLTPAIELCFSISFVLNLMIGGNMVLQGSITLGDFIAFNTYLGLIMAPIVSIGRVVTIFQRGMASLQRLKDIFSVTPDIDENPLGITEPLQGEITFNNLCFFYPGAEKPALKNISLKISKGQTIGIIGKTGAGKSSLVKLLFKLYQIDPGFILLDGKDINAYALETIRNSLGFVPQENFLFSSTIKNNIVFFKDVYSDDDIEEASRSSHIYESILGFPNRFDTMLGEQGVNLSGGQKQRISIARAIIKNPAVLILDDALSAVDTVTEAGILADLKSSRKGKTTLIISHRVSAVAGADQIIVLDSGQICETGTNDELLKKRGLYYDIFMEQKRDREEEETAEAL